MLKTRDCMVECQADVNGQHVLCVVIPEVNNEIVRCCKGKHIMYQNPNALEIKNV